MRTSSLPSLQSAAAAAAPSSEEIAASPAAAAAVACGRACVLPVSDAWLLGRGDVRSRVTDGRNLNDGPAAVIVIDRTGDRGRRARPREQLQLTINFKIVNNTVNPEIYRLTYLAKPLT